MNEPSRADEPKVRRGRWTIRVCQHGHRVEYRENYGGWLHMDAGDTGVCDEAAVVEVVPVPDEQAIERAAKRLWDDEETSTESVDTSYRVKSWGDAHELDHAEYLSRARAVLAAALEQPEPPELPKAQHGQEDTNAPIRKFASGPSQRLCHKPRMGA